MRLNIAAVLLCLAATLVCGGCLGNFAANQGRRQAARSSDHYLRKYGEPAMEKYAAENPETSAEIRREFRQGRNDTADAIVRSGNPRQKNRVGVNDRGYLTNER